MAKDSDTLLWLAAAGVAGYFLYKKYFQASGSSETATPAASAGPVSSNVATSTAGPITSALVPVPVMQAPAPDVSATPAVVASPTVPANAQAVVSMPALAPVYGYGWRRGGPVAIMRQPWMPQT